MSRRSYSKHIPDFRLVTHFAENGSSFAHRMNPWTKAALLAFVVLFVIVMTSLPLLAVLFALTLAFYASARLPVKLLIGWYSLPLFFVVMISVTMMFTEPGKQLFSVRPLGWHIALTQEGLLLFLTLLVRALSAVTFSLSFAMTTRYSDIGYIASKIMPKNLASMFLLSYRFTFETTDEVSDVMDAMSSRGGKLISAASRRTKVFAGVVGLAFVHAFERAERIGKAMDARGFTGSFLLTAPPPRPRPADYALIAAVAIIFAMTVISRYFHNSIIGW